MSVCPRQAGNEFGESEVDLAFKAMSVQSSVLYVTDTRHGDRAWLDPSARHRCYHFADALSAIGWTVKVVPVDRVNVQLAKQYAHVIFHRPKYTKRFARAFAACSSCDVSIHADYDDLIFDPALAEYSPMSVNGNRPISKVQDYFAANRRAMMCFGSILVSTRALAAHVHNILPVAAVSVLPNSLPRLFQPPRQSVDSDERFTIGYFPGSNSHAHDVSMVLGALQELFAKMPHCQLVVMGKIDPSVFDSVRSHVLFKPFVDYNLYLAQLARVDLSLAPLQRNIFNDSKSAVKLIESVAVGTPILASDNPDMVDHLNSMTSLVAKGEDWALPLIQHARQKKNVESQPGRELSKRYSVSARLPVLQRHLSEAA